MAGEPFDLHQHLRDKNRRLEQEVAVSRQLRAQQTRLIAWLLTAMFHDTHVDPLEYLQAVVDIDEHLQKLAA